MMVSPLPMGPPASPRKPTGLAVAAPSSPTRSTSRSPTKQQRVGTAPPSPTAGSRVLRNAAAAKLRAALLQTMMGLLDQDAAGLQDTLAIMHALATLPLQDPRVRRQCLELLRAVIAARSETVANDEDDDNESEDNDDDASVVSSATFYFDTPPLARGLSGERGRCDSGRAKSLSLHHCKEFLLACANEIHELDEDDPAFDYAEEIASETSSRGRSQRRGRSRGRRPSVEGDDELTGWTQFQPQTGSILARASSPTKRSRRADFDYASTVQGAPSVATGDLSFRLHDDDVEADQGSQLSDVLIRAEYMSDVSDCSSPSFASSPMAPVAPVGEIRVRSWTRASAPPALQLRSQVDSEPQAMSMTAARALATKFRVFHALKALYAQSPANMARKRQALQQLRRVSDAAKAREAGRVRLAARPPRATPKALEAAGAVRLPLAALRAAQWAAPNRSELALLLVLAFVMQSVAL